MRKIVPLADVTFVHNPWQTLRDFVRPYGGGINAGFFQRGSNHPHDSRVLGMVVVDGERGSGGWWDPAAFWHGVIKRRGEDPKIEVSPESTWQYTTLPEVEWAIGMGPIVLYGGQVQVVDGARFPGVNPVTRTQRVGFGIGGDKAVFAYLDHATAAEMGQHLKDAGAVDGILGDGGSSASYIDENTAKGSQLVPNTLVWKRQGPDVDEKPSDPLDKAKVLTTQLASLLEDVSASVPPNECSVEHGVGINRFTLSENFSLHEFECPHCGSVRLDPELVRRLQVIRDHFGLPVRITSGYRCPEHNRKIAGTTTGQHPAGRAADFVIAGVSHDDVADFAETLFQDGGLGRYRTHTHVDTRGIKARWDSR